MSRVPTKQQFEIFADSLSNKLIYSKVSGRKAEQLLRQELSPYSLNTDHLKSGFSIRPPMQSDRYGFSVTLSVKDDDGRTKVMQFDCPEKTWREL